MSDELIIYTDMKTIDRLHPSWGDDFVSMRKTYKNCPDWLVRHGSDKIKYPYINFRFMHDYGIKVDAMSIGSQYEKGQSILLCGLNENDYMRLIVILSC